MPVALLLAGCLLDRDGYEAARALLTDDDHDDYSEQDGDCDDSQASVFPGAVDGCDDLDNDCDGLVDEDGGTTNWYPDRDEDGFGDEAETSTACVPPAGWVELGGDCDDTRRSTNPEASETCDGTDEDCDGATDESAVDGQTWYADADSDDFVADLEDSVSACTEPDGYSGVSSELDCDDTDPTVYPDAPEVCGDGVVNACGEVADCRYSGAGELTHAVIQNDRGGAIVRFATADIDQDDNIDIVLARAELGADFLSEVSAVSGPLAGATPSSSASITWDTSGMEAARFGVGFADPDAFPDVVLSSSEPDGALWRLGRAGGTGLDTPAWLFADGGDQIGAWALGRSPATNWVYIDDASGTESRLLAVVQDLEDGVMASEIGYAIVGEDLTNTTPPSICDLDGDGEDEVVVSRILPGLSIFPAADVSGFMGTDDALANLETEGSPYTTCVEDVDGDGLNELIVLDETAYLLSSIPSTGTVAGAAWLALEAPADFAFSADRGDLDDDGVSDLTFGGVNSDFADFGGSSDGDQGGCAVVFYGPFTSGTRSATDADAAAFCSSTDYGYFGLQVAMSGDITGDGIDDLVSTAMLETASDGVSQGIVYAIPGLTP